MKIEHKSDCLVCGNQLLYKETQFDSECFYCNDVYNTLTVCIKGHFVCDKCHSYLANDLIETVCIKSNSIDPIELSNFLMNTTKVKMHGPEHHFLIPAVLLSTYYNTLKNYPEKEVKIKEARKRAEKVLGGFCGLHGSCGAGVGTGIFISVLTGATPLSKKEWRLSNLMTSKSLYTIANHGGPRCCKQNTYLAIISSAEF